MTEATAAAASEVQDEVTEQEAAPRGTRVFTGHLFRVRDGKSWAFTDKPPEPPPPDPVYRPARVAQMLALAHRLEAAIERGDYADRADVARQLGFTRARITQLLDLTLLAPDIQEQVLDLEAIDDREPLTERGLREVVRHAGWAEQRAVWSDMRAGSSRWRSNPQPRHVTPFPAGPGPNPTKSDLIRLTLLPIRR